MFRDRFDRSLALAFLIVAVALVALLVPAGGRSGEARVAAGLDKALEQQMAYQARVALLQKLYGPVEALRKEEGPQAALLRLDDLVRRYPGEAHGYILKGEILHAMGALEAAVASYVEGVRRNGDYIDEQSPLSRRKEIHLLVEEGLRVVGDRARQQPDNLSLASVLKDVRYLQSRLAGGCE